MMNVDTSRTTDSLISNSNKYYDRKPTRYEVKDNDHLFGLNKDDSKECCNWIVGICFALPLLLFIIGIIMAKSPNSVEAEVAAVILITFGISMGICVCCYVSSVKIFDYGYVWIVFNKNENTVRLLKEYWYRIKGMDIQYMGTLSNLPPPSTSMESTDIYVNGIYQTTSKKVIGYLWSHSL
eukprot:495557_1